MATTLCDINILWRLWPSLMVGLLTLPVRIEPRLRMVFKLAQGSKK